MELRLSERSHHISAAAMLLLVMETPLTIVPILLEDLTPAGSWVPHEQY